MRRKIWRMSEGQFNNTVPKIELKPTIINETIVEGESFCGSFVCLCDDKTPTKGIIYCDNPYIFINTPAFNESNSNITYNISAKNLRVGDELSGNFYIYSEQSVSKLPFYIKVIKKYPNSSIGEIHNIDEFCELAKRSWKEALVLFYSDDFEKVLEDASKDVKLIYRGFKNSAKIDANLEEFLAACGLKSRVYFELDTTKKEYSFVSNNLKESLDITRNTWGYIKIEIESDADFVSVGTNIVTTDYFLGSKLSLNYYIHKEKLHAGKNYATITFKGMGLVRSLVICASTGDLAEKNVTEKIAYKKDILCLYDTYVSFRLRNIDGNEWAKKTISLCESILEKDNIEDRLFFRLLKTHALIVEGSRKMALEMVKSLRIDILDKKSSNWAYLLYLGALMEPEAEYVYKLRKEIEAILDAHPEDVRVFWFLLFLKQEYVRDSGAKLRAIRHWINEGYDTPILYCECYELFLEDMYLLNRLDDFSIKILNWAIKHGGLTKEIADRVLDLLLKENTFSKKVFNVLMASYKVSENVTHLKHIIAYILKGNVKGPEYASLYSLGIESGIRLTGLFEAYLESLPLDYIKILSDLTLRYFSYNSNVSYERKALIFANIIMYKNEDPILYETCAPKIRDFCIEQMKEGHIDDNLCVCYQDILDNGTIDSRLSDAIVKIIYAKKVICLDKDARKVYVVEEELKDPQVAFISDKFSFVPVYSSDYKVFIEMSDGSISCDDKIYYVEDSLNFKNSFETIRAYATDKKTFFLHDFSKIDLSGEILDLYEEVAVDYLFDSRISIDYVKRYFNTFISFFKNHAREDIILSALLYEDRYKYFDSSVLTYLTNLLIIDRDDEKALEILSDYILPNYDRRQLLICLSRIVFDETTLRGEFVLELCIELLREGYHSDETIEYLLNHFIGLTEDMRLIFKYADSVSEAMNDFCERFIVQGLYSGSIEAIDDEILIAYLQRRPNPMIVEAYVSYFCHKYLTEDLMPPESCFAIMLRQLKMTDSVNDSCRFAYCKHLCTKENRTRPEEEMLDILLSDQINRNIYFPFYKDMDEDYILKYHLYDRMYISFKYTPGMDLVLSLTTGTENTLQDMNESYDGIYVKDIVVFFGETVYYKVYNRTEPDVILYSGEYSYQDIGFLKESRFYLINRMEEDLFFKQNDKLSERIVAYNSKLKAGKELFRII